MNIEASLKEAIETGEVLKVRYHGGSQPGALREIAPISVNGDKVRARCYSSDAVKTFVIGKVEIVGFTKKGMNGRKGRSRNLNM
jgi:predicted DNA-binding transcriptional regulator YafY